MDAHISPKDKVRVRLSTEVHKKITNMKEVIQEYSVTEDGRVYSHKSNKYLSQRIGPVGYMMVNLSIEGKCKTFTVHRLVAKAFLPNPNNLEAVNHIDGNKVNNNVDNLEWVTNSQNAQHAFRTGLISPARGKDTLNGRYTNDEIKEIRRLYNEEHVSQYKLATMYGTTRAAIQQIVNRITYQHVI